MAKDVQNITPKQGGAFSKLTAKHKKFLLLYLRQGPAWYDKEMAAIKAGYSRKGAREAGVRILAREDVQAALAELEQVTVADASLELEEFRRIVSEKVRDSGGKDWSVAAGLYAKMHGIDKPDGGGGETDMPLPSAFADVIAAQKQGKQQDSAKNEAGTGGEQEVAGGKGAVSAQETAVSARE